MATLEKTRLPETTKTATKPERSQKASIASALAGQPIHLPRTSILDVVLETHIYDPSTILPFLTGYRKPDEQEVVKALRNGPGHKIGTVLGGHQAIEIVLAARESGGEITFRIADKGVELGEEMEPDLRLASITMMGCTRFTDDHAWLVCELAGYDQTPEALAHRITGDAWKITNVVEQVPLPVAAATHDLLRTLGYSNVSVREAVARRK